MVGQLVAGRYRLGEKLWSGQFLSTYLAVDQVLAAEVEVDVLARAKAGWPVPARRLAEVLDTAMLLAGDRVASLFAWGEEEGFVYLVRERVAGASLAEVLAATGELPLEQVLEVVRAAVEVLAEAYGRGLFYLGMNPGQVLLDGEGRVRFTRVGFGWLLEDMEPVLAARVSPYRAPETDGGGEGSRTSDVYALAVMIKEMLPREGGSSRLHALLGRAMDPLPKRRPSSPRLLLEELEQGSGGGGGRSPAEDKIPGIPGKGGDAPDLEADEEPPPIPHLPGAAPPQADAAQAPADARGRSYALAGLRGRRRPRLRRGRENGDGGSAGGRSEGHPARPAGAHPAGGRGRAGGVGPGIHLPPGAFASVVCGKGGGPGAGGGEGAAGRRYGTSRGQHG